MGYHTSFAFTAPADVVFDAMADLDLLAGWLADDLSVARNADGTVAVGALAVGGGASIECRMTICRDELRLRWHPISGTDAWSGHAVVCALPVVGSVIQVKLALPGAHRAHISQVDRIMAQAFRRLDAEAIRRTEGGGSTPLPEAA